MREIAKMMRDIQVSCKPISVSMAVPGKWTAYVLPLHYLHVPTLQQSGPRDTDQLSTRTAVSAEPHIAHI